MSDQERAPETGSTPTPTSPPTPMFPPTPTSPPTPTAALPGSGDTDQPALIVRTARELAEAEGWDAVTVRRLAERAGCAQSDLYRHFADREAVVAAVAVDGYADLAAVIRTARMSVADPQCRWSVVVAAYLDFANNNPARYEAMFLLTPDLPFPGPAEMPARETAGAASGAASPLDAAFAELRETLTPLATCADLDAFTEVGWSTLHGMVMLTRGGRLRPELQERREAMIVSQLGRLGHRR